MTDNPTKDTGHPSAQIALSGDLMEKLGDSGEDYANALWSIAQQRDADADEMAALIRAVNDRFGVASVDVVVDRWQEIFRSSGGFLTIISEEHVLAGALSDANALEEPHASTNPSFDH